MPCEWRTGVSTARNMHYDSNSHEEDEAASAAEAGERAVVGVDWGAG